MAVEADKISSVAGSIRHAAFQVVSLTTTTGFCTADFDMWPNALRLILVALMFFGGCAGSTGGGIKMVRILVVFKAAWRQIRTTIQPRLVAPMKVGGGVVEEKLVQNIVGFFVFFIVRDGGCRNDVQYRPRTLRHRSHRELRVDTYPRQVDPGLLHASGQARGFYRYCRIRAHLLAQVEDREQGGTAAMRCCGTEG
jgi:hypothetical protein